MALRFFTQPSLTISTPTTTRNILAISTSRRPEHRDLRHEMQLDDTKDQNGWNTLSPAHQNAPILFVHYLNHMTGIARSLDALLQSSSINVKTNLLLLAFIAKPCQVLQSDNTLLHPQHAFHTIIPLRRKRAGQHLSTCRFFPGLLSPCLLRTHV